MRNEKPPSIDITQEQIEEKIGPIEQYAQQCHAASIALVKSGLFDKARVARGSCHGVGGQHSWVVLGDDCYDMKATIVDLTLWSYVANVGKVHVTNMLLSPHRPKGYGPHIMRYGCPQNGNGPEIVLTPSKPLSYNAQYWIDRMFKNALDGGNLDFVFWANLVSNFPVIGWPAAEIIEAMLDTEDLAQLVPIDIVGMITRRNPGGLYLP